MNEEQINKMIEDTYDESKEDTIRSMIRDFYSRKMLSVVVFVWAMALIYVGLAIFSGVQFFRTDEPKYELMYAVIFICSVQLTVLIKIVAWQMIHRNSIKREIKRLEIRIAQLAETVKNK